MICEAIMQVDKASVKLTLRLRSCSNRPLPHIDSVAQWLEL